MTFDTLKFANRLKAAGMEPVLAEAQAEAMFELVDDTNVATKTDIADLRSAMEQQRVATKADMADLRRAMEQLSATTKTDIDGLRVSTKVEIDRLGSRVDVLETNMDGRFRLLYWMVGSLTALNAAIAAKLFL